MAGMLPGVEAARRRRFHKTNNFDQSPAATSSRRSFLCLYAASHDLHSANSSRLEMKEVGNKMRCDESNLGEVARQAKKRLDERLQPHKNRALDNNGESRLDDDPKVKRSGRLLMKRAMMGWLRVRWKWCEVGRDDECAVCLEPVRVGTLMRLGCGHRFHTNCLLPWLQAHAHCPCCRTKI